MADAWAFSERRVDNEARPAGLSEGELPPPAGLRAEAGAGQVTLRWEPVRGAIGYLVQRAESPEAPFETVDHGGRDVLAVPGPVYCDTTGRPDTTSWYAVASIAAAEAEPDERSDPVEATPDDGPAAPLDLVVRADRPADLLEPVWRMVGSEHVSQLFYERIGSDFEHALVRAREELGAKRVRAHAILHDELRVYRDGPQYDFSGIDRAYDRLLELGLRPVVELSFMPRDLASDPTETVFAYGGIISPPRDWDAWAELCRRLAEHLVERYGFDEVADWGFEVWNEPDLNVFWSGTQAEYFRLYEVTARAIKAVDPRLLVGGPATAAAHWIADFLDFVVRAGAPLDFLSTHTYGNLPLDVGQALAARGLEHVEVWWTEWGVTPTHFDPISDSAFAAAFVLHGMKSAQGRAQALAYWVVSDHFEELGRPPRLLHGGFGLMTVGGLRKPRWWALALAESLGPQLVEHELTGDGAGSLVDAWATRDENGTVRVLVWNGTLDQSKEPGDGRLDRKLRIRVEGLEGSHDWELARVDHEHSNIGRHWHAEHDWPTDEEWQALRAADRLDMEPLGRDPAPPLEVVLPMPGVARLQITPADNEAAGPRRSPT